MQSRFKYYTTYSIKYDFAISGEMVPVLTEIELSKKEGILSFRTYDGLEEKKYKFSKDFIPHLENLPFSQ